MSSQTKASSSSMPTSSSQTNCFDSIDSMLDFSEYEPKYEPVSSYPSPSMSPTASSKSHFVRPTSATPTANNTMMPSGNQQALSGPSHQYDLYKQQTGIPTGAIASTLAINQQNIHINPAGYGMDYFNGSDDFIDFGTAPRQHRSFTNNSDMDMEYDSATGQFYREQSAPSASYVDPTVIGGQEVMPAPTVLPTQSSNVGRLWPGMHQQQAALAKAQAQQKQQQQIIQQQRMQAQMAQQPRQQQQTSRQRGSQQPSDPIVEEKISQLLNSMRQSSVSTEGEMHESASHTMAQVQQRMRKDEEEMDEDERLLASEEGKKLSSKERRQLRNKVSARAFRSRRKEYIGQLEGEIAMKVNENNDLRSQNRALMDENQRLSDLTRMLLSSPSFSGFLDTLSQNPAALPQAPQTQIEQRQPEPQQVRKDVNPYGAQHQMQHVGMTMIPEQTMDFSMLDINSSATYNYQPQVFAVLELPEEPIIDTSALSGKASNFISEHFESEDEKIELPIIERQAEKVEAPATIVSAPIVDEEFDNDPEFALFVDSPTSEACTEDSIFGGIKCEKALARIELVDASQQEATAAVALGRVHRLCESLEEVAARLSAMTIDL